MVRFALVAISLVALTSPVFAQAAEVDAAAARTTVIAVHGPLPLHGERLLTKHLDYYGDFGTIAVGEGSPAVLDRLTALGFDAVDVGAWPRDSELIVAPMTLPVELADLSARVLDTHGGQQLVAVPSAEIEGDDHLSHHCPAHGFALVTRSPWKPSPGFRPRHEAASSTAATPGTPALVETGALPRPHDVGGPLAAVSVDPRISPLVSQVSGSNIQATVTHLSSYSTRRATEPEFDLAKDWAVAQFQAIGGLTVSEHSWTGTYGPNVVAELPGLVDSDRVVVLGAHLDSINLAGAGLSAPGADDNASGSGGVLEAARILSQQQFEYSIHFVLFSAEEFGLIGAGEYADLLLGQGKDVFAMLNMDMISHRDAGDALDLDFATNSTDPALTQFCIDVTAAYVPTLPTVTGVLGAGTSDHAAFQARGIPAAFFFEDLGNFSTVIHTSADVLGSSANDFVLAERITQAFVASAATLAQPVDLSLSHLALSDTSSAGGPYAVSTDATSLTAATVDTVELFWRVDGGAWQSKTMLAGNNADEYVGSLPGVAGNGIVDYYFLGTDSDGNEEWLPEGAQPGDAFHSFSVGTFVAVFDDDFETAGDNGWTHQQVATQDDWQHDVPNGLSGDPSSAVSGTKVWGNDLGPSGFNGAYQPNVHNLLDSPFMNMTGQTNLHLRFQRWLTVEDAVFDQATIFVNGNQVWQNPAGGGSDHTIDTSWSLQQIDVSSIADNNPSVQVRYQLESDGGLEFGGWNIDDFELTSVGPGTVDALVSDEIFLSAGDGGIVNFSLDAGPSFAGRKYAIAIGASGTSPGTPLGFVTVPLNFDALTTAIFNIISVIPGWLGTLDGSGQASGAAWISPAGANALAGVSLYVSWFTYQPIDFASNAVEIIYVP